MLSVKPINLLSLINAKDKLTPTVFDLYLNNFETKIKNSEIEDLRSLLDQILDIEPEVDLLDGYYIGYTINQIGKEFDLLRFGESNIINIELKRENTGERIKEQLIRNKYYLGFLDKSVLSFTYVSQEQKLFYLDESDELKEVEMLFLISELNEQKVIDIEDIHKLFDPSNYLVSPFNSTESFIQNKYFLTEHQDSIKKSILKLSTDDSPCYISIEGSAGTGKTLLIYDIAKEYINSSKSVLIIHCGTLNRGHNALKVDYSWEIAAIRNYKSYNFSNFDVIIFDETQRIVKSQFEEILEDIKETNVKCIFSYDKQQCLGEWEIRNDIPGYIQDNLRPKHFQLTEKIRTNKEIASFIKNLFDLSKRNPTQVYSNIEIRYFSTSSGAKQYIETLETKGWKAINYTPSQYATLPYERFQNRHRDSAHKVIGQEFDKVIAVIDRYFYYDQNGLLSIRGFTPYYHLTKMLFQIVTRARKKLTIVIINNEQLLEKCLGIIK
ncbi:DNA/RNA helicase domain-containing protein [Neobacillus sp. KR4-4]|uniref:DNA/RNA helicase domain-containing protein n=1 Tax=Neobacillus sp. KR4-4 TaxID=3344872 RepID=UPI0035C9AA73